MRDGDEFALRQFEHIVTAVDVDQPIRFEFSDDVAGLVETVVVEDLGGDLRPLVVPGNHGGALQQQLAARMRFVGPEVAQLGDVREPVVEHRRSPHLVVDQDSPACLGGAVSVVQIQAEHRLHEGFHLRCHRRAPTEGRHKASAEKVLTQFGFHLPFQRCAVDARPAAPVHFALIAMEHHVAHARNEKQLGRPGQRDVVEERGHVARGREVRRPAARKHTGERHAAGDMAHRHVVEVDRGQIRPVQPHGGDQPFGVHRALRRARTARGVDQQRQRILPRLGGVQRRGRQATAAFEHIVERFDDHRAARDRESFARRLERRTPAVVARVVVEDHQPLRRGNRQDAFDGRVEQFWCRGDHARLGLPDDRGQLCDRRTGLQWNGDQSQVHTGQVDRGVVTARESEHRHEIAGVQRILRGAVPRGGNRADALPQFAVGEGVEVRQQSARRTAGGFVRHYPHRPLPEGGPIGIADHNLLDDLREPHLGLADRLDHLRTRSGIADVFVLRVQLGDVAHEPCSPRLYLHSRPPCPGRRLRIER